jgi:ornithine cyclodeaminase
MDNKVLVLTGEEILSILGGQENELMKVVAASYKTHGEGKTSLPHSTFLFFPEDRRARIIALPAYMGGQFGIAGVKWISSFPANIGRGMDRASAVMVLNSLETGQPIAILEGSVISAKRTAASAALAAKTLLDGAKASALGLIGCGPINFEILRFLLRALGGIQQLTLCDLEPARVALFQEKCAALDAALELRVAENAAEALANPLVCIATTAATPHITSIQKCPPGAVILHISLRDISPKAILAADNIVDDADHIFRAETSLHLTERQVGSRNFVRCTLADILRGQAPARTDSTKVAIFSPFGIGILDLAVAKFACDAGHQAGLGTEISSFLPPSWETRSDG